MTAKTWLVVIALVAGVQVARAQEPGPCARTIAARRVLEKKVTARFERFTLDDCITFLHETAGIEVAVSPNARAAAEGQLVSLRVRDVTVRSCMELIVGQLDAARLRWTVYCGVVLVGDVHELRGPEVVRMYDVSDLGTRPSFPAPDAGLFVPDWKPAPTAEPVFPPDIWICEDA